jgi:hypothetical protein
VYRTPNNLSSQKFKGGAKQPELHRRVIAG